MIKDQWPLSEPDRFPEPHEALDIRVVPEERGGALRDVCIDRQAQLGTGLPDHVVASVVVERLVVLQRQQDPCRQAGVVRPTDLIDTPHRIGQRAEQNAATQPVTVGRTEVGEPPVVRPRARPDKLGRVLLTLHRPGGQTGPKGRIIGALVIRMQHLAGDTNPVVLLEPQARIPCDSGPHCRIEPFATHELVVEAGREVGLRLRRRPPPLVLAIVFVEGWVEMLLQVILVHMSLRADVTVAGSKDDLFVRFPHSSPRELW